MCLSLRCHLACLSVLTGSILLLSPMQPALSASIVVVTSTADSGPGTLRAALASAVANDVITFAVGLPATITLTTGELFVPSVTITGPGAANLTISGNNGSRVFHINASASASISGLTISNGSSVGGGVGAAIYNDHATLMLANCLVNSNIAGSGGAIYNDHATLTLTNCLVDGNTATSNGGGIYNTLATLTLSNSTISNNSGTSGGGIYNDRSSTTARNCTFSHNGSTNGGACYNLSSLGSPASLTLNNCTFSSNFGGGTSSSGGAIYNNGVSVTASLTVGNSTFSKNQVPTAGHGGAIFNIGASATVQIGNTILSDGVGITGGTIANSTTSPGSISSSGYNLSSDAAGGDNGTAPGGLLNATGDQRNTDPLFDPADLQNNGGPTMTIALQATSPAIDKGKRDAIASLATNIDQRAEARPFDDPNIANASGGDGSDIGAYEADVRLTAIEPLGSDLRLSFTSIVGHNYEVQNRTDLIAGNWNPLPGTIAGNGGIAQLTITNAFPPPRQFYRVHQLP